MLVSNTEMGPTQKNVQIQKKHAAVGRKCYVEQININSHKS